AGNIKRIHKHNEKENTILGGIIIRNIKLGCHLNKVVKVYLQILLLCIAFLCHIWGKCFL
ncbi:MAG: hypothetical protein ACUVTE_06880, partial [Candidatus Bathycorpusculaceae bacterium]